MLNADLVFSFILTWAIALAPPTLIRVFFRKPLKKSLTIVIVIGLYFFNHILLATFGASSTYTNLLAIGAFFSFFILRWQTKSSADQQASDERKKLGYD